jgi:hypothetical protein
VVVNRKSKRKTDRAAVEKQQRINCLEAIATAALFETAGKDYH